MRRSAFAALAMALALLGACGGPNGPTVIPPPAPQISCPSPVTVDDVTTGSQTVAYAQPTVTGGAEPVSVACTPQSGVEFPLGETQVTCAVTDAQQRQSSCSFGITLRNRQFALTKYLAFGDSMTEGENGRPILGYIPFIDLANAYPTILQQMFAQRIPTQPIAVVNVGRGGERVSENESRLKAEIAANHSEVLLLLEGINDLNAGASPQSVADGLRFSIGTARERGVQYVFVSTLLPVAPENCGPAPPNCRGRSTNNDVIQAANALIRAMVPATSGYLVDPYDVFLANRTTYIDIDGLHLRPEGNRALANGFWDRIVQVIPAKQLFGS